MSKLKSREIAKERFFYSERNSSIHRTQPLATIVQILCQRHTETMTRILQFRQRPSTTGRNPAISQWTYLSNTLEMDKFTFRGGSDRGQGRSILSPGGDHDLQASGSRRSNKFAGAVVPAAARRASEQVREREENKFPGSTTFATRLGGKSNVGRGLIAAGRDASGQASASWKILVRIPRGRTRPRRGTAGSPSTDAGM